MRRISLFFLALTAALLLGPLSTHAYYTDGWGIKSFTSDIALQKDASMHVQETVKVDFAWAKHGIYRDIPVAYKDRFGQPYNLRLTNIHVADSSGDAYQNDISRDGEFLHMRIGDPDETLTGEHTYVISYDVTRAFSMQQSPRLGNVVEIPWNITGTWGVDMEQVLATITLPPGVTRDNVDSVCLTGVQGSTERDCSITADDNSLHIKYNGTMLAGSQITASVQIPASSFDLPSQAQQILWFLMDNFMLLYAAVLLAIIIVLWFLYGKEFPLDSIMPRWEIPEGVSVLEAQMLLQDSLNTKGIITGGLMYLATRGYIKIQQLSEKSFAFTKLKEADDLPPPEEKLMQGLFASKDHVTTADLKNKFYAFLPLIHGATNGDMVTKNWFFDSPASVITGYIFMGILLGGTGILVSATLDQGWALFANILVGVLWLVFSLFMPKRTRSGRQREAELRGLREYIKRAETLRLKIKNPPGQTRQEFDRLLPFAIIFGLEKEWTAQFAPVLEQEPDWFEGSGNFYTTYGFLRSMDAIQTSSTKAMTSTPPSTSSSYSSGGGSFFSGGGGSSSGGGFGGGGGGSW